MELAQALEVPLLGTHPDTPETGIVKYYTLASDLREYVRFDSGNIQYRQPRYWKWNAYYNGTTAGAQWLRNTDASPHSRRTNFLVPFDTARLANVSFSSRNNLKVASVIQLTILEDAIDGAGDVATADPVTVTILSTDIDAVSYLNGKRFFVDLRSRDIVLDNTKRYAMRIDSVGDNTSYRDPKIDIEIEERVVQP